MHDVHAGHVVRALGDVGLAGQVELGVVSDGLVGGWPSGSPRGVGWAWSVWSSGRRDRLTTTVLERAWARLGPGGRSAVQARAGHRRRRHPPEPATRSSRVPADPSTPVHPTPASSTTSDAVPAPPSILVLGGTGLMGREVLGALRRRGVVPRVLVRDPARLASRDGVEVHVGDLRDPASLRRAMHGVDVVFHISPHEADEIELTRTVIRACEDAGARLVFAGVHVTGSQRAGRLAGAPVLRAAPAALPRQVRDRPDGRVVGDEPGHRSARATSCRTTRCSSTSSAAASSCTRASPKGLNRVDLRDVGEVAAGILLDPTTPSGTYPVVGPALAHRPGVRPGVVAGPRPAGALRGRRRRGARGGTGGAPHRPPPRRLALLAAASCAASRCTPPRRSSRPPSGCSAAHATDYVDFVARVAAEHRVAADGQR